MLPLNIFTDKEVEALKQFGTAVSDLGLNEDDFYYVRWLRARDLNVKAAEEMLRESMKWRKDNDIDSALEWQAPEQFAADFAYDTDGIDKDGCPIFAIPFGKWDVRKAVAAGQRDVYLRYMDQMCERMVEKLKQFNKNRPANDPLTQAFIIWDLDGFSLRQITAKGTVDVILEGVKRVESNYPEILKISFGINGKNMNLLEQSIIAAEGVSLINQLEHVSAPRVFSLLFALIKPLLTPRTLEKVQLFGSNSNKWKAQLLKHIPADQLIPAYGGTRSPGKAFQAIAGKSIEHGQGDDDMCVVTVDAGDTLNIVIDVKHPNSTLKWAFRTDDFDIGFSIYFNGTEQLLNLERVEAHVAKQEGNQNCAAAGRYTLAFDNTYSMVRAKTLYYMVTVVSPEQDDDENLY